MEPDMTTTSAGPPETPSSTPASTPDADLGTPVDTDQAVPYDPEQRTYQRMSLRGPAVIVLAIAVFILVGGVVASALFTSGSPKLTLTSITIPDGTVVQLTPATTALKPIIDSQPPSDILAALAVPAKSTERRFVNTDQNLTQYDRSVSFTSGLASDQLVAFYQTLLPKLGWKVTDTAADPAGTAVPGTIEVLATKGSQDGYYWEVGAVVSPSTSAGSTSFTIDLYEQEDQD
jgi:hypothetical protein